MDAVGFALGASLLGAGIQWLSEGADESALDHVTAAWEFPVGGLTALTLLFLIGHYLRARQEVFVAHRERGDKAEKRLAEVTDERAQRTAERDDAQARARKAETTQHISIASVEKLDVHLPAGQGAPEVGPPKVEQAGEGTDNGTSRAPEA